MNDLLLTHIVGGGDDLEDVGDAEQRLQHDGGLHTRPATRGAQAGGGEAGQQTCWRCLTVQMSGKASTSYYRVFI